MSIKVVIGRFVSTAGFLAVLLSLSADLIGVDRGGGWGPARRFALLSGIVLFILPLLSTLTRSRFISSQLLRWFKVLKINDRPAAKYSEKTKKESEPTAPEEKQRLLVRRWIISASLISFILSIVLLTWLISVGRWSPWPGSTNYYHLLADGFRARQTHLLVAPPADLLTLSNPYDPSARKDLFYLWDVSLFDGKYYLYWGPSPALVVSLMESLLPVQIGDHHLTWLFCLLSIAFLLMTSGVLWDRLFPQLPGWAFLPVAITVSFAHPFLWMMSRPAVYEAAIAAGQFFLLASLYLLLPALLDTHLSNWRLFLAGLSGGLAIASRVTLLPAIVLLLSFALWRSILLSHKIGDIRWRSMVKAAILLLPFVLVLLGMALYNFDRFGSVFELGHKFQLGRWDKSANYDLVASVANIPLNLQNYFLNGVRTISVFPYIKPTWGDYSIPILRLEALNNYHTEKVIGVLFGSPFIILGILPLLGFLFRVWHNLDATPVERIQPVMPFTDSSTRKVFILLLVLLALALSPLLLLSVNSMRHEMDFLPIMLLLSVIGYGQSLVNLRVRNPKGRMVIAAGILFAALTVSVGFMLAITGSEGRFETQNPELFLRITRFFTL